MLFGGLQKLTLLDYPDKTACTVFTTGCNFRCPFCHNPSLVLPFDNPLSVDESEILSFLETRRGLLDGICISGGEPLMHEELEDFIRAVRSMGFSVKLDTNGSFPGRLQKLVSLGLIDYVAMDIKNAPERYFESIGLSKYDTAPIKESIRFLLSGKVPYEFRTTVVRELHTSDDLLSIAHLISGAESYYLQKFVDSENLLKGGLSSYTDAELLEIFKKVTEVLPATKLRG